MTQSTSNHTLLKLGSAAGGGSHPLRPSRPAQHVHPASGDPEREVVVLCPGGVPSLGVGPTMILASLLCFAGFLLSWFMAPETKGLALTEASAIGGGGR